MALVYPHRLTFLKKGKCDVCDKKGSELVRINTEHYFGWETCDSNACNQTIQKWYADTSKPIDKLVEQLGELVYIQRSNGRLESNWAITSDAHKETENGPYWVQVKYQTKLLFKTVQLSDLEKWNSK